MDALHRNVAPKYRLFELNSFRYEESNTHTHTRTHEPWINTKETNEIQQRPTRTRYVLRLWKTRKEKKRNEKHLWFDERSHTRSQRTVCGIHLLSHFGAYPHLTGHPVRTSACLTVHLSTKRSFSCCPAEAENTHGKNCVPVSREQPKKWHREAIQQNCANKIDIYGEVKRSELAIWQMLLLLAFFALSSISCVYYSTGQQTYRKKENECSSFSFRSQGELPNGIILLFGSYSAKNNQKICCCCCLFFPVQICALFSCNQV